MGVCVAGRQEGPSWADVERKGGEGRRRGRLRIEGEEEKGRLKRLKTEGMTRLTRDAGTSRNR